MSTKNTENPVTLSNKEISTKESPSKESTSNESPDSWEGMFNETNTPKNNIKNSAYISHNENDLLFGFISWNIGENIRQNKINQLIQEFKINVEVLPDIIVIGFQEIPVSSSLTKLRTTFKKKIYKPMGQMLSNALDNDYSMLDTYDDTLSSIYTRFYPNENKNINLFTCANFVSANVGGFAIATYIFKLKSCKIPIVPILVNDRCIGTITGYCAVTLQIGNFQTIDIVNTHMPFANEKTTNDFAKNMLKWLYDSNFRSKSQVILGDLNSRILLTNDCYAKDITNCKNKDETEHSKYCYIKKKLESLPFDRSIMVDTSIKSRMRIKKLTDKNCNIETRVSKNRLVHNSALPSDIVDIQKLLLKSDYLHVNMKTLFPDFKEDTINFLPTYKRNPQNGKYSLSKNNEGRLPGYADRILITKFSDLKLSTYQPLSVTGNDHLPISSVVKFIIDPKNMAQPTKAPTKTKNTKKTKKNGGKRTKANKSRKRRKTTSRNK